MTESEYLAVIRPYLHDPDGKVWDDDELLDMIKDAAAEYCRDTGIYRGSFCFRTEEDGSFQFPENFLSFVAGWNEKHLPIFSVSSDFLADRYGKYGNLNGSAEYVYENLDSIGSARLCPNPHELQNVITVEPESSYGIFKLPTWGIPAGGYHFGLPIDIWIYESAGEIQFVKNEDYENIQDYMAIVYHTLYQAFTMDSDFKDESLGTTYYTQYQSRVAKIRKAVYVTSAVRHGGAFF